MSDELEDFKEFLKQREAASNAYVSGDADPLRRISARELPATFFSPRGDYVDGAEQVSARYEKDAAVFESSNANSFETLQMAAESGIAYWVGFQHSTVRMKGHPEEMSMTLRVTEIFRREGEEWKIVHRHADMLKPETGESK